MKLDKGNLEVVALSLLAFFLFIAGCGEQVSNHSKPPTPEREVAVCLAQKGDLAEKLSLTGTLLVAQEVKITSKIPGRVDKVLVEEALNSLE